MTSDDRRFVRRRDGRFSVGLEPNERQMLAALFDDFRDVLLTTDDPSLTRLFPPAYANDPDRNEEYVVLTRDELLERRFTGLDVITSTLTSDTISEDELLQWMGAVNSVRLVLGTRLDVGEEMLDPDPEDPAAAAYAFYVYLGFLLEELVEAVSH